ncbi:MAG: phytoene desaturase family protein [Parvibaculaceae bacterium]
MSDPDYVIVGSGINALVAAALLGKSGKRVLMLERNERIGGCIRSEEITAPGYIHDVMATTFVLFVTSPAYAALASDLGRHGLEFCHSEHPTGVLLPDGRSAVIGMKRAENGASLDRLSPGDGVRHLADVGAVEQNAILLFALLGGRLWGWPTARLLAREAWRRGPRRLAQFFGEALTTARAWLEANYRSDVARALWAPWVLHAGLSPESAYSAQMAKVIAFALEAAGAPIVKGGGQRLLDAFTALIRETGGEIRTKTDVTSIVPGPGGRARGVRLAAGGEIAARAGIICSVTPNQLYERLLDGWTLPAEIAGAVSNYRYGKGNFQLHYALKSPPRWREPGLEKVALLHLTLGLDGVSKAANEAERGMLPEVPTICVGQPTALDPSRCPEGAAILWLQLPEAPRHLKGDAAGRIAVPADGSWTDAVREAYADRVEAILAAHIADFAAIRLQRKAYSPADLERLNVNLAGGDPYGGFCGLDQSFLWRPFKSTVNHRTFIANVYHIGASTHPGAGLSGGSGFMLAQALR